MTLTLLPTHPNQIHTPPQISTYLTLSINPFFFLSQQWLVPIETQPGINLNNGPGLEETCPPGTGLGIFPAGVGGSRKLLELVRQGDHMWHSYGKSELCILFKPLYSLGCILMSVYGVGGGVKGWQTSCSGLWNALTTSGEFQTSLSDTPGFKN